MSLTLLQQKFADLYIELGNATQAAKKAGYSEKTAYSIGNENLKKPEIKAYIAERLAQIEKESIASIDEVMKFYTKVMRGKEKDQFGLDASLSDRMKAGGEIIKRLSAGNQDAYDADDDNLIEALEGNAEQLFEDGDDSEMLPEEDDE
ncbi:MAG: terminase small subunit [Clostridia bacterium]|nr:terminase small subunit [Clostridia bacterium]